MRKLLFLILTFILLSLPTLAHEDSDIYLTNIWARPAGEGEVSAVYLTIENPGDHPIKLVEAHSDVAESVEIHQTSMENDVMRMSPVEDGIEIPAGESVALEPGGYHIMLINLLQPLDIDGAISLSLAFEMLEDDGTPMEGELHMIATAALISEEPLENPEQFVVVSSWARPTALARMDEDMVMDVPPSATYLTLINLGEEDDTLIAVSSPYITEIHSTTMDDGVMRMGEVEGIEIPAGESIVLEPGGFHIMMMQMDADLIPGDAVSLTLTFESGAEMTIAIPVRDELEMMEMDMNHEDES